MPEQHAEHIAYASHVKKKPRIIGYDIAKSLAMLFVVILHYSFYTRYYSSGVAGTLLTTLCVACVPLFFAVNGALLLPRPLDIRKHLNKTLTIVAVLAVWKTIVALFCVFVDRSHPAPLGTLIKNFLRFQLGGGFGDYPVGYFWFMNALLAVYLVYPLVKLVFDDPGRIALRTVLAVLFAFTVGKDTLAVLLDMLGAATHHEFTSILGSLGEFYIFGSYGYVLLYFMVGGLVARAMMPEGLRGGVDGIRWPLRSISRPVAALLVVLCYAVSFGIQRFQHATKGTNLTIDYGYWLLPTFAATLLALMLCLTVKGTGAKAAPVRAVVETVGKNTFGIYMLHMIAIVLFAKSQAHPALAAVFEAHLNSGAITTLLNIACVLILFAACLAISVVLRRIPGVRTLFTV